MIPVGQIPHLITLSSRVREASGDNPEAQRLQEFYLEQLQYCVYAAVDAVLGLADRLVHSTDGASPGHGIILVPEPTRNTLGFAVDHYFDAARRALNAANVYISKTLRTSVPASFADLVKQIRKGGIQLPERIQSLTMAYWEAHGNKIKAYRDLSQHFAVISSDARVTIFPDGKAVYYLVLPNNPEEKNPTKLSYVDPRIDAFPYIVNSYNKMYRYLFELTHILMSYTYSESPDTVPILFKSPLNLGAKHPVDGHLKPDIDELKSYLIGSQLHIYDLMKAELPRKDIQPTLIITGKTT
ncbi:MAG: hypothetical protein PHU49_06710 [Syntrophorhabdaceae bacterium]|nr:hypothetical protein [Syntrophorhabdaceae bacterium]MDD5243692.1 hypothetical protein [Syntrophorhabdaceae bacterium]